MTISSPGGVVNKLAKQEHEQMKRIARELLDTLTGERLPKVAQPVAAARRAGNR